MELFGIVLSIPVAFVASLMYCFMLAAVDARYPTLSALLRRGAWIVLALFVAEVILLATMGAVGARAALGSGYYASHLVVFFLGTPALANVLMLGRGPHRKGRWLAPVLLCTLFALVLVLLQYGVSEALFGID